MDKMDNGHYGHFAKEGYPGTGGRKGCAVRTGLPMGVLREERRLLKRGCLGRKYAIQG